MQNLSQDKTLQQLKSFRDTLRTPGAGSQKVAIAIIILFALLLIVGIWGYATSDNDGYLADDTSSSQSAQSPEEGYLNLLEMERPHNFASDADAIQFGYAVCDMLDTEYLSEIGDQLSYSQYGILRGVDSYSRGAGIAAAGMVLCPEHLAEISRWSR